jgi:HAE1 family hydrophobic/amphiphilic exporter-1
MNLAELFIRRPIMTTLVMATILIFGLMAYRILPVSDLPNVDFPTIQVNAGLPGASPETMAAAVALPLEKQFSTIAGLDSMSSSSGLGSTSVTLQFALDRDIDAAAQDVQSAIAKAGRELPPNMPSPPSYQKVNPADSPILFLAMTSDTLPLSELNEYAETLVAQRISMIAGVAQVQVFGSQKYAVRIQMNPDALAARGIGVDELISSIQRGNSNLPTGTIHGPEQVFTVESRAQLLRAADYRPLIVAYRNGSPVRLEEVARVVDSVENDRNASWFDDKRSITLAIQRQPGTNTVDVVDRIRALLPILETQLPPAAKLTVRFDRSISIRESVHDVQFTMMLTISLVVMVIFLFLRNLSATVIPSLAVPMSIIGTFSVMYLLGYSLNNLSLMALTLCVGFVVDDAIVMLENIVRHMEQGERPLQAALRGSKEISFTIVSMTLSLAAVFIPVLFMGGIVGRLLHEFAVTIAVAILISGFVSLSLTPMLCSRYLRPQHGQRHNWLFLLFEKFFRGMHRWYDVSLQFCMRHHVSTMALAAAMVVVTVYLYTLVPKGFLPSEDTGQISGITEGVQGIAFDAMKERQARVADIIRNDPNVESFMSSVSGGNTGRLFLRLKPRDQRPLTADELIQDLRPKFAQIPGIRVFLNNPPPIRIGGMFTRSQYQFALQNPNTDELYEQAAVLEAKLKELPGLQDVNSDLQIRNPQVVVDIDRDRASSLGLTAQQVEEALFASFATRQVSSIYAPNNQYRVITELRRELQTDPSAISKLYVRSSNGSLVPLDVVATISRKAGPLTVNHIGQLPAVTLSFNLKPGVALGDAVDQVNALANATLPANTTRSFQGTAQAFEASTRGLGLLLLMAIVVIYIVLGILYESFIHPLTILSGLPSAGLGALLTLYVFKLDLSLYAFVGVIMLVGIVKKNAIMMIDFALEAQRKDAQSPEEAIYHGALIRFRPIMMTTMAALMGTLPIALGLGAGAESRRPLGLAVVGGLLISQFVTLYLTPVFYVYMEAAQKFARRLAPARREAPAHADD